MKHIGNSIILLIFIAVMTVNCVACGKNGSTVDSFSSSEGGEVSEYSLKEHALPDANAGLITKNGDWVRELDIKMVGDRIYRLAQLWGQDPEYNTELDLGYYIQISEYPYTEWKNYEAPYMNVDGFHAAADIRHGYYPCKITGVYDDVVYFAATGYLPDDKYYFALGKMDATGAFSLTNEYPIANIETEYDPFCTDIFFDGEDTVYSYQTNPAGNEVISYKISTDEMQVDSYPGAVEGIRPSDAGAPLWFGNDETSFCGGTVGTTDSDVICKSDSERSSTEVAFKTPEGWYFSDAKELKLAKADNTSKVLIDWRNRGYNFNDIREMEVRDKDLRMLTDFDGRHYVLDVSLDSQKMVSRQEVVISMPFEMQSLMYYVSVFNRTNTDYHISASIPEDTEDPEEYRSDLKTAFVSGEGPDLIVNGVMNQKDMVRGGLISSVDELIADKSAYFDGALKSGQFEGVQYGIPYEFYFDTAVYSENLLGGKESLTLNELMNKAEEMDAEALALGVIGEEIVFKYGLLDDKNTAFIDWSENKSHLDGPEFAELLDFAAKYSCPSTIDEGNYKEKLDAGKVISESAIIGSPEDMNYLDACFDGNASMAGYPRTEGCGVYMVCNMLYLNSNASCSDGAKAFLQFIIDHDTQMLAAENRYVEDRSQRHEGHFPVEMAAFYREVELAQVQKVSEKADARMNGISFPTEGLSKENADKLKELAEVASPVNSELDDIADIIYDELESFFLGQRSVQDVANVMNSRVQIYLDE